MPRRKDAHVTMQYFGRAEGRVLSFPSSKVEGLWFGTERIEQPARGPVPLLTAVYDEDKAVAYLWGMMPNLKSGQFSRVSQTDIMHHLAEERFLADAVLQSRRDLFFIEWPDTWEQTVAESIGISPDRFTYCGEGGPLVMALLMKVSARDAAEMFVRSQSRQQCMRH